jgi:hypothetical protein
MGAMLAHGTKPEAKGKYGILFASDCFPPLNAFPDAQDIDECFSVCSRLNDSYPFVESALHPGLQNIYSLPGNRHSTFWIYEIVDPAEQQKIVQAARRIRQEGQTRPFSIEFYGKESEPFLNENFLWKVRID